MDREIERRKAMYVYVMYIITIIIIIIMYRQQTSKDLELNRY